MFCRFWKKKKKKSSLEVGAPPRVTPAVLTEFHAIGGEEVGLGVEVSWRISGPLIPQAHASCSPPRKAARSSSVGRSKGSFNLDTHPPAALLAFLKTGLSPFFSFSLIQLLCVPIYRRCTDSGPGPGCRVQDVSFEAFKQNWKTGSNKGRKVLQTLANICLLWCDRVITTKHGGGR